MTLKKIASKLHLWLGLIAGLVLVINLIPASIFVFEKELSEWVYHDQIFADQQGKERLPLSILKENAQAALPKTDTIGGLNITNDRAYNYAFGAFRASKNPGITFFSEYEVYKQIYVNPYTGMVQGVVDMRYNWIYLCRVMHQQMLLRYDIGHFFIGIASIILIVSLITGLILWYPRNKAAIKQRFSIKWNARWRRKNYDVHNVGGFYTHLLILLLACTGLIWSFGWWAGGFYKLLGDDYTTMNNNYEVIKAVPPVSSAVINPIDLAFEDMLTKRKSWTEMYVGLPDEKVAANERVISSYLSFNDHSGWDEGDVYQYSASTGLLTKQILHQHKSLALKWQNSNYKIHTGSIYGLPTKILMCLGTLFCASLPITGFLIWIGRNNKKKSVKK